MTPLSRRVLLPCALLTLPLACMQAAKLARAVADKTRRWIDTVEERIENTATGRWD